jgi:penicillin-binding protein 2
MFSHRTKFLQTLIYISFLILAAELFYFQIIKFGYYKNLSLRNAIRIIPLEASRGTICDRNNQPLARDEISFDLAVIPQELKDIDEVLYELSKITGIEKEPLLKNYRRNYYLPFVPVKVATNIQPEDAFRIDEKLPSVQGAIIDAEPRRTYPNKWVCSHAIGYVGRIAKPEFEKLKDYGYEIKDLVGKSGIEKYYDAYLKGEDGGIQVEVDARSRVIRKLGFKEPRKGKDIKLTIDLGLQRFVEELLAGKKGAFIVMNAKTGEVLALSSSPGFDPNIFILGSDEQRKSLLTDSQNPLLNRAIASSYPPGSTFKIIIAAAGVAKDSIKTDTSFFCDGTYELGSRIFNCWNESGHGYQNIIAAIAHSCNIFFYNLGRLLGAEEISHYAWQFGIGVVTGIDLPGEVKGLLPSPLWKRFFLKEQWYEGDTVNFSIGQGYLLVTPIQMLRAVTIIANEGYCPTPYLVEEIEGKKSAIKKTHSLRLREGIFKVVKKGMFDVVNDPTGTGQYAKLQGVSIAGKTGTAQPGTAGNTHAWFVGYMPAEEPKVSFVVFLEHGGQGGGEPARMVKLMAEYLNQVKAETVPNE